MGKADIQLTSAEIATLWSTYIQNSAMRCFYKHFLQYLQDADIKSIIEEVLIIVELQNKKIETIFVEEDFPIPKGFSDKDVDLSAPALFTDLYALSFVYRGGQIILPYYATALTKVARTDIANFFEECLSAETKLYRKSLNVMLSKGVYDRPPKIDYPKSVEFIQHQSSLLSSWFGEGRPLNTIELEELFFAVERNSIGLLFLMGLIQVSKDKEVKEYLIKGKKLSEKQIETFNKILKENDGIPSLPVTMEVTNSTISPFSERLILFIVSFSNQIGISTLGNALSVSMRKDLSVHYSLFLAEIIKYGGEGNKLLIERGWMEQPPQGINRRSFYKT